VIRASEKCEFEYTVILQSKLEVDDPILGRVLSLAEQGQGPGRERERERERTLANRNVLKLSRLATR
jgi:hypothetical protein